MYAWRCRGKLGKIGQILVDFRRLNAYNIKRSILSFLVQKMEIKRMEFMTVKEAASKWGLSERRLQTICNEGMIPGVIKFGRSWAIPMDAQKPVDKRIKSGKYIKS